MLVPFPPQFVGQTSPKIGKLATWKAQSTHTLPYSKKRPRNRWDTGNGDADVADSSGRFMAWSSFNFFGLADEQKCRSVQSMYK